MSSIAMKLKWTPVDRLKASVDGGPWTLGQFGRTSTDHVPLAPSQLSYGFRPGATALKPHFSDHAPTFVDLEPALT